MKTITWLCRNWVGTIDKPSVIISLGDPGESMPDFACDHIDVLRLEFDDVDQDLGPEYRMFDWTMARKLLTFEHRYKDHDIIVHCHAGISRSAAVAIYMADKCGRLLDVSKPCSGKVEAHNRYVYRQLQLTHVDLCMSKGQVTLMPEFR